MIDHELNMSMAKLCGFKVHMCDKEYADITKQCVFNNYNYATLNPGDGKASVFWNPVGDWNQVFQYVLPAMAKHGFDISIDYPRNPHDFDDVIVSPTDHSGPGDSTAASFEDQENPSPRVVCETILKATERDI